MKKLILFALLGMMFLFGAVKSYAQQQDSAQAAEEANDTISIDKADPVFYDDETTEKSSNTSTYAIIGAIVVVGGVAFYLIRKKKKQA